MNQVDVDSSLLPISWIACPKIGEVVNDMFVPFKTPIDEQYDSVIPSESRFSLDMFLASKKTRDIGMIIDLSNTSMYYNPDKLANTKCYNKMNRSYDVPSFDEVNNFIELADSFFQLNQDAFIGVHCTLGYNLTGFMIISYLFERCNMRLDTAIHIFANARRPGIYDEKYLEELTRRYQFPEYIKAPLKPDWTIEIQKKEAVKKLLNIKDLPSTNTDILSKPESIPVPCEIQDKETVKSLANIIDVSSANQSILSKPENIPVTCEVNVEKAIEKDKNVELKAVQETDLQELATSMTLPQWIKYKQKHGLDAGETVEPNQLEFLTYPKRTQSDTINERPTKKMYVDYLRNNPESFQTSMSGIKRIYKNQTTRNIHHKLKILMKTRHLGFPGSKATDLGQENLHMLADKPYLVTWKADGIRSLLFIIDSNMVVFIDEDHHIFSLRNTIFPWSKTSFLFDTIIDGEYIWNTKSKKGIGQYYISDIISFNGEYVGDKAFTTRIEIVNSIMLSRKNYLSFEMKHREYVDVMKKTFYSIDRINEFWGSKFLEDVGHKMDGLIFQPSSPDDYYVVTKSNSLLKWHPLESLSIDFYLRIIPVVNEDNTTRFDGHLIVVGLETPFDIIRDITREWRKLYKDTVVKTIFNNETQQWELIKQNESKDLPYDHLTAKAILENMKNPLSIENIYKFVKVSIENKQLELIGMKF